MVHATDSSHLTMKRERTRNLEKVGRHLDEHTHHPTKSATPGVTVSFSTKHAGGHTQPASPPPAGLSEFCCHHFPAASLSSFQGPGAMLSVLLASTLAQ